MPLLVSVPLGVAFYFGFRAVMNPYHYGMLGGFLLGYVLYDCIHYATHHWPMKNRFARFIKEYHMKHHYVDDHTAFGVSNPMWDYVFNTVPEWARNRGKKRQGAQAGVATPAQNATVEETAP
jgi:sterol desaturase/sphingolipid hydroxylase (fatty acid hydroxylase superfamily)